MSYVTGQMTHPGSVTASRPRPHPHLVSPLTVVLPLPAVLGDSSSRPLQSRERPWGGVESPPPPTPEPVVARARFSGIERNRLAQTEASGKSRRLWPQLWETTVQLAIP